MIRQAKKPALDRTIIWLGTPSPVLKKKAKSAIIIRFIMQKHILRITVALTLLLAPLSATAATLQALTDSIAGLGAEISIVGDAHHRYDVVVFPEGAPEFVLPTTADAKGKATVFVPGKNTVRSGMYHATLAENGKQIAETAFVVLPDVLDPDASTVDVRNYNIAADGRDEAEVTVTLSDRFGNPLPGRPVELIGTGDERSQAESSETDARGRIRYFVSTRVPGVTTLRAYDVLSATVLTDRAEIQAGGYAIGGTRYDADLLDRTYAQSSDFDVIERFVITVDPPKLAVNEVARNVLIQAVDRTGSIDQSYTADHVRIYSPTDAGASLPGFEDGYGDMNFTPRERGEKNLHLVVSFKRPGTQVLRVEDRTNPNRIISGEVTVNVYGEASGNVGNSITVTSHADGDAVPSRELELLGATDGFVNLNVMVNGVDAAQGETDQTGAFSIPLTLTDTVTGAFTIRIQDDTHRLDSGPIGLTLDTEDPEIASVTFTPEHPVEGSDMLVVAASEPKLASMTVSFGKDEETLTEDPKKPGTYQALIEAPAAGTYQPTVIARDRAGNMTQVKTPLIVSALGLPQVKRVRAQGRANAVELTWDPVTSEDIEGYRIYVGEEEDNFLYTLDTKRVTDTVIVASLKPATTYYFAVTALKGDRESAEKSETATALVLGTKLNVTENDGALLLEWAFPEETPLQAFLLEYGVAENAYTEKRILNGALRAFTLRDLLNGVEYHLRLTPIAASGDPLTDLAALGSGTPNATVAGFHAAATDPIPFDPDDLPPSNDLHAGAPRLPIIGLPPIAFWIGLGLAGVFLLMHWHRRRTLRLTQDFLRAMDARTRN